MEGGALGLKLKIVDNLQLEFHRKLSVFAGDVKTRMRTSSREMANQCFELALVFLSQVFPNLEDLESTESEGEKLQIDPRFEDHQKNVAYMFGCQDKKIQEQGSKLKNIYDEFKEQMAKLESKQQQFYEEIKDNVTNFARKEEKTVTELSDKLDEESKKLKANTKSIEGIKKKLETSESSASTLAKASSSGVRSNHASFSLRQVKAFKIQGIACLSDAKLLSSKLLLIADTTNSCIKLFNTEGTLLKTLQVEGKPSCLAILNAKSQSCWDVVVSFEQSDYLEILEINGQALSRKSSIITGKNYHALAVLDSRTLVAIFSNNVDLIDLSGKVLCTINDADWKVLPTRVSCLDVNGPEWHQFYHQRLPIKKEKFEDLQAMKKVMTTEAALQTYGSGYKLITEGQRVIVFGAAFFNVYNLQHSTQGIQWNVPGIESPSSVARLMNGAYIIANTSKQSLHLVFEDGSGEQVLWSHPNLVNQTYRIQGTNGLLSCVTVEGDTCVTCSSCGSVFVFSVLKK